jgi:predicted secreted protein
MRFDPDKDWRKVMSRPRETAFWVMEGLFILGATVGSYFAWKYGSITSPLVSLAVGLVGIAVGQAADLLWLRRTGSWVDAKAANLRVTSVCLRVALVVLVFTLPWRVVIDRVENTTARGQTEQHDVTQRQSSASPANEEMLDLVAQLTLVLACGLVLSSWLAAKVSEKTAAELLVSEYVRLKGASAQQAGSPRGD